MSVIMFDKLTFKILEYTMEKNYVGMALCYFCNEVKEILIHDRLAKTLLREAVYDTIPCDDCARHMKNGIILISIKNGQLKPDEGIPNPYRSGDWLVVKEETVADMFGHDCRALKSRVAFVDDEAWDKLGLPRPTKETANDT